MADGRYRLQLIVGVVFGVAAVLTVIMAFSYAHSFQTKMTAVTDSVEDADAYRADLSGAAQNLLDSVSFESSTFAAVLQNLTQAVQLPPDLNAALHDAVGAATAATATVQSVVTRVDTKFALTDVTDRLFQYNALQLNLSSLVFSLLIFTMSMLVLMSLLSDSPNWLRNTLEGLALLSFFVSTTSGWLHLGVAIGVADMCQQPYDYTMAFGAKGFAEQDLGVVSYYLYCDPARTNPLIENVAVGYLQLNATTLPLIQLVSYLNHTAQQQPEAAAFIPPALMLQQNVSDTLLLINGTAAQLDCTRLHGDVVDALNTLCGPALNDFHSVMLVQLISAFFLLFARFTLPTRQKDVSKKTQMMYEEFAGPQDVIVTSADGTSPNTSRFARYASSTNHSVRTEQPNDRYALAPSHDSPPTLLARANARAQANAQAAAPQPVAAEPPLLQPIGSAEGLNDSLLGRH